ncbi:MAG: ribosomal-protein-alanine acetyltransferase [Rhodothermales bacterium]|jgi:ribosomal-protein-alanine acetyltransferase
MPISSSVRNLDLKPGMVPSAQGTVFRAAAASDLPALLDIENAVFPTDRLSRRSFRHFLTSPRAIFQVVEIQGVVAGYYLVRFRRGTAAARLYSLAVAPAFQHRGLGARLVAHGETAASEAGCAVVRLEVATSNQVARALYQRSGYRQVARLPGYYENGEEGVRLEKPLRFARPRPGGPPYYEQTTEFTCGPACLMMALAARNPDFPLDATAEVRLWRRSTTVFMTKGLGGCEPFGMAVTLAEEGLHPEIHVSEDGPLMLQTVRNAEKRKVMMLVQDDFHRQATQLGVPRHLHRMDVPELAGLLRGGALALVLVSGNRMFGKRVPHWVLAHGADDHHIFLHDPWIEATSHESATDATDIPVPFVEMDRMWRWGATRLRAAVLIPPLTES